MREWTPDHGVKWVGRTIEEILRDNEVFICKSFNMLVYPTRGHMHDQICGCRRVLR